MHLKTRSFVFVSILSLLAAQAAAEELRIETDIFVDDAEQPISHTTTLFDSAAVYDFTDHPEQIAVFRPAAGSRPGQFILLDVASQRRTEVSLTRIEGLMQKVTTWAAEQKDPLLRFSAQPVFSESFDEASGALTLDNPLWNYTVATVPAEHPEMLAHYREFTDWYSRLNTMMGGTPPPGPRLALNAALEKHIAMPVEIRRTVSGHSTSLRSVHLFSWRLSRDDRARLDQARQYLAEFEKVDNETFVAGLDGKDVVRGQSR